MEGALWEVVGGDLITLPCGASHALANATEQFLTVFVLEVFPGETGTPGEVAHLPLRSQLLERIVARDATEGVFSASIDLARYFTGNWADFTLAHISLCNSKGRVLSPALRLHKNRLNPASRSIGQETSL